MLDMLHARLLPSEQMPVYARVGCAAIDSLHWSAVRKVVD